MVGSLVLELLNTGAHSKPVDVLTFAGYFQLVRLLGGQMGTAFMLHFIPVREEFHSKILGQNVSIGNSISMQRLYAFRTGIAPHFLGLLTAAERAGPNCWGLRFASRLSPWRLPTASCLWRPAASCALSLSLSWPRCRCNITR